MIDRFDASVVREKDGKSYWTKIGSMWPNKGSGFTIVLDALPLANAEGQARIILTVPKPKDNDRSSGGNTGGGRKSDPDSEDIPFRPQVD